MTQLHSFTLHLPCPFCSPLPATLSHNHSLYPDIIALFDESPHPVTISMVSNKSLNYLKPMALMWFVLTSDTDLAVGPGQMMLHTHSIPSTYPGNPHFAWYYGNLQNEEYVLVCKFQLTYCCAK